MLLGNVLTHLRNKSLIQEMMEVFIIHQRNQVLTLIILMIGEHTSIITEKAHSLGMTDMLQEIMQEQEKDTDMTITMVILNMQNITLKKI